VRLIYLFAGMLVLMGIMSGCTTKEKPKSEDEAFKEYVRLIGESAPKRDKAFTYAEEAANAVRRGDYDLAIEIERKIILIWRELENDYKKAANIIEDDELKSYAEINAEIANLYIKYNELLIDSVNCLIYGDIKCVKQKQQDIKKISNRIELLSEMSHNLYLKLNKEGKL